MGAGCKSAEQRRALQVPTSPPPAPPAPPFHPAFTPPFVLLAVSLDKFAGHHACFSTEDDDTFGDVIEAVQQGACAFVDACSATRNGIHRLENGLRALGKVGRRQWGGWGACGNKSAWQAATLPALHAGAGPHGRPERQVWVGPAGGGGGAE